MMMKADVGKLVGCTLTDITIRTFKLEFRFAASLTILVRVKKAMRFGLSPGEKLFFEPTIVQHDLVLESSKFAFMQGMKCIDVILRDDLFEISFDGGARLWVELGDRDFEPLEFVGLEGERHEKMTFFYVL